MLGVRFWSESVAVPLNDDPLGALRSLGCPRWTSKIIDDFVVLSPIIMEVEHGGMFGKVTVLLEIQPRFTGSHNDGRIRVWVFLAKHDSPNYGVSPQVLAFPWLLQLPNRALGSLSHGYKNFGSNLGRRWDLVSS